MQKQVTIGVPIYKRLNYLPDVLRIVAAQDYPNVELLVSDNGMNGRRVHEIVAAHYARPHRVRQNPSTVPMSLHFNQIINDAAGDYFVLLADDDEISANYVSELLRLMERNPQTAVAFGIQETVDEAGNVVARSSDVLPGILSGTDFIRSAWGTHEYGYKSFSTFLARTADLRACGGFPDFCVGRGNDDALVVKLCLNSYVAFTSQCVFRKRFYAASFGFSASVADIGKAMRDFLRFLESDDTIRRFAHDHPARWRDAKHCLIEMIWKTYHETWADTPDGRRHPLQWAKAGFAMPFIPAYYRAVAQTLLRALGSPVARRVRRLASSGAGPAV
jgi:glycosyltransferase involved in cell wall biosynthesis